MRTPLIKYKEPGKTNLFLIEARSRADPLPWSCAKGIVTGWPGQSDWDWSGEPQASRARSGAAGFAQGLSLTNFFDGQSAFCDQVR
jgi:hypothetical protein